MLLAAICSLALAAPPADWPQFLGPQRNGISPETGLNTDWRARPPKTLWKVPLGSGFSSLAVVGDRVYTMAQRGDRIMVICLDARTGKERWGHDAGPGYNDWESQGPGPRSTPTCRDGRLYCLLPRGELLCLTTEGKKVWEVNTFEAAGARSPVGRKYFWGMALSPLVVDDLVVVQPGGERDNSVVAFHKDTGKKVWGAGNDPPAYASPIVITAAGRRQLVCPTGQSILGLAPDTGRVLWRYAFGNRFQATCATPVWADGLLFVSAAYATGSAALDIVADGDGLAVREKWRNRSLENVFATSMVREGHVYGSHGNFGAVQLRCLDLQTGQVKWDQRQPGGRSTLLLAAGHLICLSEDGTLRLVEARPDRYVLKGELRGLLEHKAWATPALADGRLYLRDQKHALCLDLRAK